MMREFTSEKSREQLETHLEKHMTKFAEFKLEVLDNLVDWNQKTVGLSKLATKYLDTLEEYKMMFVQMKQYLKEKDAMIFKTRTQMLAQRESHKEHVKRIEKELMEANGDTLGKLKDMTKTLETKLVSKENQCDQLIRY